MKKRLITVLILLGHVLALLIAVSGLPRIAALVVLALSALWILRRLRRRLRRPHSRLLGAYAPARIVGAAAVMVCLGREGLSVWDGIGLVALAALVMLTSMEGTLGRIWRAGTRVTANLPGLDLDLQARRRGGLLLPIGMASAAVAAISVWVPGLSVLALLMVLATGAMAMRWTVQARRQHARLNDEVAAAVRAHDPSVMVYVSGPAGTEYQFGVWTRQFEELAERGERVLVVTREPALASKIGRLTELPVVSASQMGQLEIIHQHPFKVCLYVNNGMKNSHNIRYSELVHVQLLHGDSDKPSSYNPVTAMFDRIFVAGQAGIDRYAAHGVSIPRERFEIVGRPQVGDIEPAREHLPPTPEGRTALYAPTWTGFNADNNFGSLAQGPGIVRALLAEGWSVVFRPHPYSRRNPVEAARIREIDALLEADAAATGRPHAFGAQASREMSIVECFNASDALVADVSSVPADYLFSEKPFVITKLDASSDEEYAEVFPLASAAVIMDLTDEAGIGTAIRRLGGDDLAGRRREMRAYYLGDIPRETYAEAFPRAVLELVASVHRDPLVGAGRSRVDEESEMPEDDEGPAEGSEEGSEDA
ncbi:CDP-glycerol glycerophosphotransferase family protein [Brachybacterium sp. DNPG3]